MLKLNEYLNYVGKSISELQIQVATYVFELSAGNCLVLLRCATIGMRMRVKTEQLLQDGGAPEYVYHVRTAWRCAVSVGKRCGSKGYPQRNAAHVR